VADATAIQWTDATWNPITGCSVVSPGCTNCYAMQLAGTRLRNHPSRAGLTREVNGRHVWTGEVRLNREWLDQPLRWRKPRKIFVCAHADLFHENVLDEWIAAVFGVMAACPQHVFQVLTKRPERALRWFEWVSDREDLIGVDRIITAAAFTLGDGSFGDAQDKAWSLRERGGIADRLIRWPLPNVWFGVSVEDQQRFDERAGYALRVQAAVHFVSYEPALGPIDFSRGLSGELGAILDWGIYGGESGLRARPNDIAWPRLMVKQFRAAGVAPFVKQLGARPVQHVDVRTFQGGGIDSEDRIITERCEGVSLLLRHSHGGDPSEWPEDLRVREFPA